MIVRTWTILDARIVFTAMKLGESAQGTRDVRSLKHSLQVYTLVLSLDSAIEQALCSTYELRTSRLLPLLELSLEGVLRNIAANLELLAVWYWPMVFDDLLCQLEYLLVD